MPYEPDRIEPKWQQFWDRDETFRVDIDPSKEKYYILDMFPYPSGAGLHVGHPKGYTSTDILARWRRMQGRNVLHPMGWDAFGLPTERAAVRDGIHPAKITKRNTDNFRGQIKRLGFSYDWSREIDTSSEKYYRWTQWIFLKLYERGLAYQAEVPVNWCPAMGTVLANEEVQDGKYVETGDPVERRMMRQWMLKITAYAQRLLDDLDGLDWPDSIKKLQSDWIGRSEGAKVTFRVADSDASFLIYTTRPDTLFGATYCVLAPEHPLVESLITPDCAADVKAYVDAARNRSERDRISDTKTKTGVFTGSYALNPVNDEKVPIWVADYVLMGYGTGAIMAVPGHDERDYEFAKAFELPIVEVVSGGDVTKAAHTDNEGGRLVASGLLDGMTVPDAKAAIIRHLEEKKLGHGEVQFRLRDWLFSRQRYWGEPFPVMRLEDGTIKPMGPDDLPLALPPLDDFRPTDDGDPPLARAGDWLETTDPETGKKAFRETNTMPQWAGSCWYYLRFLDPHNGEAPWSSEAEKYWMPVDVYVGGAEHAVLHLLYARFWHKVMYDAGLVSTVEPFQCLRNQGMILAHSFQDEQGKYYHPNDVTQEGDSLTITATGAPASTRIEKMSKSKLNVVNPEDVIGKYGADSMRLYEVFMGPLEGDRPWQMEGVDGVRRFLDRVWRLYFTRPKDADADQVNPAIQDGVEDADLEKLLHKTIAKVTQDLEQMSFNTAISAMMIFVNEATGKKALPKPLMRSFIQLLGPFAPHIAEEVWESLGESPSIAHAPWPVFDAALAADDVINVPVQINGKVRDVLSVSKELSKDDLEKAALSSEKVIAYLDGKEPRKVIAVPGRIVNIVK